MLADGMRNASTMYDRNTSQMARAIASDLLQLRTS
jgi:hypothetical protein